MDFVLIFGPPAVGKMTVGAALARLTGFKLFHNHMTIDLVLNLFSYEDPTAHRLIDEFRRRIFEAAAASDLSGLIFTYVWALDDPGDKTCVDGYCDIFRRSGARVHFVELEATRAERLIRNQSEYRLAHKPSKRNLAHSEAHLLEIETRYQMNSNHDFFYPDRHLKIHNTQIDPGTAAARIMARFELPSVASDEQVERSHAEI